MPEAVSRRALFARLFGRGPAAEPDTASRERSEVALEASVAEGEPAPARPRTIPVLRPPGAIEEAAFLAGCTRCNACIAACPPKAIVLAPARFRAAAGTPMIDPTRQPCLLCTGLPCIAACEPGVLSRDLPVAMGRAALLAPQCLNRLGTACTVCIERCPVPGAIAMHAGLPVIDDKTCTGCGICHHVCPAPTPAILILAALGRPPRPT
jgi:MauM/NapG family ferredoxin protein